VSAFLSWLAGLSAGDLYERIVPYYLAHNMEIPKDMAAERDREVEILAAWDREYFSSVDPDILAGLQAEADAKRKLIETMRPVELIELATEGLVFEPDNHIECVLLVPQYHHRPWIIYDRFGPIQLYSYSADVVPRAPGEPSPGLLRVARALSDESRLRMLHYIAESPRTRNELARLTGLSRSTVHHHTVSLRAAGLIRVRDAGEKNSTYSLRPGAEDSIAARLRAFLGDTNEPT
jgi:DNA-binding transcriptional ArsR family regulator